MVYGLLILTFWWKVMTLKDKYYCLTMKVKNQLAKFLWAEQKELHYQTQIHNNNHNQIWKRDIASVDCKKRMEAFMDDFNRKRHAVYKLTYHAVFVSELLPPSRCTRLEEGASIRRSLVSRLRGVKFTGRFLNVQTLQTILCSELTPAFQPVLCKLILYSQYILSECCV